MHYVLATVVVIGAVAILAWASAAASHRPKLDPATGCQTGTKPSKTVGFILDSTDPLGSENPRRVDAAVNGLIDRVGSGDLVLLVPILGEAPNEVVPAFGRCAPIRPEQVSYFTGGNPRLQAAAFSKDFAAPLLASVGRIRAMPDAPRSPIAEVISGVASDQTFLSGQQREIDVLTDGLENANGQDAYHRHFRLRPAPKGLLSGTTVKFYLLRNPGATGFQTEALVVAWTEWVENAGGKFQLNAPWLTGRDTEGLLASIRPPAGGRPKG